MRPFGISPWWMVGGGRGGGGGSSLLPETQALLAAMTVQPSPEYVAAMDEIIGDLISAKFWGSADFIYVPAATDLQAASLNWIRPAKVSDRMTETGTPDFTPLRGWRGGLGYVQNSSAINSGGKIVNLNDFRFSVWVTSLANGDNNFTAGYLIDTNKPHALWINTNTTPSFARVGTSWGQINTNVPINSLGLFSVEKQSANGNTYFNGIKRVSSNAMTTGTNIPSAFLRIGQLFGSSNNGSVSSFVMAGINNPEHDEAALFSIVKKFMNSIGIQETV